MTLKQFIGAHERSAALCLRATGKRADPLPTPVISTWQNGCFCQVANPGHYGPGGFCLACGRNVFEGTVASVGVHTIVEHRLPPVLAWCRRVILAAASEVGPVEGVAEAALDAIYGAEKIDPKDWGDLFAADVRGTAKVRAVLALFRAQMATQKTYRAEKAQVLGRIVGTEVVEALDLLHLAKTGTWVPGLGRKVIGFPPNE